MHMRIHSQGKISLRVTITVTVCALVAIILGYQFGVNRNHKEALPSLMTATIFPTPRTVSPFSLIDNKGNPYSNKNLQGHWTFVFFGFTNCPYICPTTMTDLNKVYENLQKDHVTEPNYILISIDPNRDTVARMEQYVTAFNKNFIGLTGKETQTDALAKAFNVLSMKVLPKSGDSSNYNIDHSGTIMLLNPEGNLVAIFSMPHDANKIAKDYQKIVSYYS